MGSILNRRVIKDSKMNSILSTISVGDIVEPTFNVVIPSDYSAEELEFISEYCDVAYEVLFIAPFHNAPVGFLLSEDHMMIGLRNLIYVINLPEVDEDSDDEPEALLEEIEENFELRADELSGRTFMVYLSDITSLRKLQIDLDEEPGDSDDDY